MRSMIRAHAPASACARPLPRSTARYCTKPIGARRGRWRRQVAQLDRARGRRGAALPKRGHPGAPHLARRQLAQAVEHVVARARARSAGPSRGRRGSRAYRRSAMRARRVAVGRLHLVDVHAVEDRLGNRALVVGGRDPDHLAGVDRHLGELVGEGAGGVVLEQAVQRAQRVVGVLAAGLVDLVDHHHRVGVLAVDQGLEHLAGTRALPLARGARSAPSRRSASSSRRSPCRCRAARRSRARNASCRRPAGPSSSMGVISSASRLSWHSASWRFTSSSTSWKLGSSSYRCSIAGRPAGLTWKRSGPFSSMRS